MQTKLWKIATSFKITNGKIQLFDKDGNKLPGKGTKWIGSLNCTSKGLTTFEGMPEWVTGSFWCSFNQITSFKYCPQIIGKDFWCFNNQFTSFKYCPQVIGGLFVCSDNQITSFKYCPQIIGEHFNCSTNQITSFKYCPQIIGRDFYCFNNQITSFKYCPQIIGGNFNCYDGKFTSLEGKPSEYQNMFIPFYEAGYIKADGILTKLISERKKGDVTIYKTQRLASDEIIYVAKQGDITAHGKTARKAVEELAFRNSI